MEKEKEDLIAKQSKRIKNMEENAENKMREMIPDMEKRLTDDEKIEIMTQFMLDPSSSATKLLEKRREMYELQEALQRDKEKFNDKEAQFKKTEEDLRMRDEEFHKKIVEYYKNSHEKRTGEKSSHQQKIANENNTKNTLKKEIKALELGNKKLKDDLDKMKEIYDSLREYEEFLKKVKDKQPDNYSDVTDIIVKYNTLESTLKELEESGKQMTKRKEEERNNFRNKKAEYENRINQVLGEINLIQQNLKEQKERKKILENEVTQFEKNSNNISSSLEQILLAIQNIHKKCDENSKNWTRHEQEFNEKPDWTNPEQRVKIAKSQLKNINSYLEDYKELEEKCKQSIQLLGNK